MIPRHQLAVAPRIPPASLLRALPALAAPMHEVRAASSALRQAFGAHECILTDSGTSALVLALRLAVGKGGIVALPGYGCLDFASAVRYAGVLVRLYDVDPTTMSPDLGSVERTLHRGVAAVVVAHFYGYPADVTGVRDLAARYAVPVVEDAAQAAAGTLHGNRLGAHGDLSVLSFGRGKGLFGGSGGALLAYSRAWDERLSGLEQLHARRGTRDLVNAATQWALGRPTVYSIPASLPFLKLGEMVYHPAHEPRALSGAAASLLRGSLEREASACARRRVTARVLRTMVEQLADNLVAVPPISGADPGFLRFAVLDRSGGRGAAPRLGVMNGYPRILREQEELAPSLASGEPLTPGAAALRDSLFTLPTHDFLDDQDFLNLQRWIAHSGASRPQNGVVPVQRRNVRSRVPS